MEKYSCLVISGNQKVMNGDKFLYFAHGIISCCVNAVHNMCFSTLRHSISFAQNWNWIPISHFNKKLRTWLQYYTLQTQNRVCWTFCLQDTHTHIKENKMKYASHEQLMYDLLNPTFLIVEFSI